MSDLRNGAIFAETCRITIVYYEIRNYRLVINVNKNGEDALFYSDNYKDQRSEGVFKVKHFNRFLC